MEEANLKMEIQRKVEPVDIREVDEESMAWTLNDSMDHEDHDSDASRHNKNISPGSKKQSIFHRTKQEKLDYLDRIKDVEEKKTLR